MLRCKRDCMDLLNLYELIRFFSILTHCQPFIGGVGKYGDKTRGMEVDKVRIHFLIFKDILELCSKIVTFS